MKINKKLNLVISVERDDGGRLYVHSTPLAKEVFDRYFIVIAKAFAAIYGEGLGIVAGPRIAALMLKKIAVDMNMWDGAEGVQRGLMNEIVRLTNAIVPTDQGWKTITWYDALGSGLFDEDQIAEVEGAICFFTLASAMHKKEHLAGILQGLSGLWGTQIVSSNCTEYANSLQTLTKADSTGERSPEAL